MSDNSESNNKDIQKFIIHFILILIIFIISYIYWLVPHAEYQAKIWFLQGI